MVGTDASDESSHVHVSDDEVNASDVFESAVFSYDMTEDEPASQQSTHTKKQKLNVNQMKQYDYMSHKSIEDYVADEMKAMQQEMQGDVEQESDDIDVDEEITSEMNEQGHAASVQAMKEYFDSHQIRMAGPWRSTSEQRVQRHLQ